MKLNVNKVGFCCFCLQIVLYRVVNGSVELVPTSTPPPAQSLENSMRAGIKDGGEVRVDISGIKRKHSDRSNECRRVSMRRYLGDPRRNCTSIAPIPVAWCKGTCVPQTSLMKTFQFRQYLEREKIDYQCVPDRIVRKRVKVFCHDVQAMHVYKIKVVKTCKCKLSKVEKPTRRSAIENNDSVDSISRQVKRFDRRLHNLQNKLRAVH